MHTNVSKCKNDKREREKTYYLAFHFYPEGLPFTFYAGKVEW
jgi:hypothetical protein